MSKLKKKLRGSSGFSLGEVLVVVLILLLLTAMITAGIPTAQRAYNNVVDAGNAEVLLSTTLTIIQSELSTATEIIEENGKVAYYKSGNSGLWSALATDDGSKEGIRLLEYAGSPSETAVEPYSSLLVTRKAATANLYTVFSDIVYSDGVFTINGLLVLRDGEVMTPEFDHFKVIALNNVIVH